MFTFIFNIFYYLVTIVIALFFLLLGVIGIILPWSPSARSDLIQLILEDSIAISLFGFGFLVVGGALLISVWSSSKRAYYYAKVADTTYEIDQNLIHHYLEEYWKKQFPQNEIPTYITIRNNRIKIDADLPYAPREMRKEFTSNIQKELRDIFNNVLGYPHEFTVALSFQRKEKTS